MRNKAFTLACSLAPVFTTMAVAADAPSTNKWETTAAAGLTLTSGNSETTLGTISINSTRKWPQNEILLGTAGTYGKSEVNDETETTAQSLSAYGQYNHSITERWYAGFRADFLHDRVADLSYRVTLSPLAGYYAIKNPTTSLKFEAGPSGVFERQGGEDNQYAALRLGERFEHKFSDKSKVWQSVDIMPQIDRFENYIVLAEIGAEAALTPRLSLRAVLQDMYDNEPADDREKNDIKLITSLAYKF